MTEAAVVSLIVVAAAAYVITRLVAFWRGVRRCTRCKGCPARGPDGGFAS